MEELLLKALEVIKKGERCAFATVVETKGSTPRKTGSKMVIYEDGSIFGSIGGGQTEHAITKEALLAIKENKPRLKTYRLDDKEGRPMCGGVVSIFIEPLERSQNLIIVGAGHIALALSFLAKLMHYQVTVIDNRKKFANKKRFPHVDKIMVGEHHRCLEKIKANANSLIVITTHGHRFDYPSLCLALETEASYIGLMASKIKAIKFSQRLLKEGFSQKDLKRIHMPVGLDIGAQTPEEIAVSIMAEIVALERGKESLCLKSK